MSGEGSEWLPPFRSWGNKDESSTPLTSWRFQPSQWLRRVFLRGTTCPPVPSEVVAWPDPTLFVPWLPHFKFLCKWKSQYVQVLTTVCHSRTSTSPSGVSPGYPCIDNDLRIRPPSWDRVPRFLPKDWLNDPWKPSYGGGESRNPRGFYVSLKCKRQNTPSKQRFERDTETKGHVGDSGLLSVTIPRRW